MKKVKMEIQKVKIEPKVRKMEKGWNRYECPKCFAHIVYKGKTHGHICKEGKENTCTESSKDIQIGKFKKVIVNESEVTLSSKARNALIEYGLKNIVNDEEELIKYAIVDILKEYIRNNKCKKGLYTECKRLITKN